MSLAHLTLATRDVQQTATFFEETLGYRRDPMPTNIPDEAAWLNLGRGQQIHLVYVDGFEVSPSSASSDATWRCTTRSPSSRRSKSASSSVARLIDRSAPDFRTVLLPRPGERLRVRGD